MPGLDYYRAPAEIHQQADAANLRGMGRTAWMLAEVARTAIDGLDVDAPDTIIATSERMALDYTTELYAILYAARAGEDRLPGWDRGWYREALKHDVRCSYRDACDRIAKAAA